ncbi:MAG: TIGR04282 family arsenosugar biosynthesis glycosyltransferase [Alphaproteobacteria bacterium]
MFARAPRLGRVKQRLARDVGAVEAVRFYRATLARLLRDLTRDRRWRVVLTVAPDRAAVSGRGWPRPRPTMIGQGPGDLGRRMARALGLMAPGPAVLVGSDIPALGRAHVWAAFEALGRADVVFGPAEDGGYWLVGRRHPLRRFDPFAAVRWSTRHALADTRANLDATTRVALLAPLRDVDDGAGLRAWRRAAKRVKLGP